MQLTPRQHNVLSYGVALIVMPVVALLTDHTDGRWLPLACWVFHFTRRTFEALTVHRYGKPTFPWGDALVEYVYYWGFATWIGATLPASTFSPLQLGGLSLFVLSELGNARAHFMLRQLRDKDSGKSIPRGFLFEAVSCPHYLCEILSWVGFSLLAPGWASAAFTLLATGILGYWAHTRHAAYRRDFDGREGRELYPSARRALVPGVF